jgi:hypothetical protein
MSEKQKISLESNKRSMIKNGRIYNPLEFYLDSIWQQQFIPENTVYITAAASSGGYRAYLERWGEHQQGTDHDAWKPNGDRQHTIIGMNAALISDMVDIMDPPKELNGKKYMIPHEIGLDVPSEYGTLMGKNEADLMMQWMMRIAGVTKNVATRYYETMMEDHEQVRNIIGDPSIPKGQKINSYIELIQTFVDTLRNSSDGYRPVSAIILGLDWKNSLGSRFEAAVAQILMIPLYEMVIDPTHKDYQEFLDKHHLRKIKDRIHLPTISNNGKSLLTAVKRNPQYIEEQLKDLSTLINT